MSLRAPLTLLLALTSLTAAAAEAELPKLSATGALGEGFILESEDEAFRVNLRARLQLRGSQFGDDDGEVPEITEFQARRIRLLLQGHVAKGKLEYYLQLAFSNQDMESDLRLPLRDAYVTFTPWRDVQVRAGQMKVPHGRQRVVSSSALQMVDRSIVTGELNLDRDVGVQLFSTDLFGLGKRLGYNLGLFSGDGRNRLATAPGVLVAARLFVRPFGDYDEMVEGDHERRERPGVTIGVSAASNKNTQRPRSTFETPYEGSRFDYRHYGADLVAKWRGLSLQGEFFLRESDRAENVLASGETEYARPALGWYAQGGYLIDEHLEATARYGVFVPQDSTDPDFDRERELGAGLNWYFQEHDLKVQSDYFYLFGADLAEGRHQIRVQFQLYF